MIPHKKLPDYLQGISVDPAEREEYLDAMSNGMRLVEYLRVNDDVLTAYDLLVMMKVETERDHPRVDIFLRLKGKYNGKRNAEEYSEILKLWREI